jgi:hypothetical protein
VAEQQERDHQDSYDLPSAQKSDHAANLGVFFIMPAAWPNASHAT